MIVCSPCCGIDPDATSGGAVAERETLRALPTAGITPHVLLPMGKRHDYTISNQFDGIIIERIRPARGLAWPAMALVLPYWIRRCWRQHGCGAIRAHSR